MPSFHQRLTALEKCAASRWGEYDVRNETDQPEISLPADIESIWDHVRNMENDMSELTKAMDRLTRESAETGSAVDAMIAQFTAFAALYRENAADPAAIHAIADAQDAYQQRLAAAAVANTPATNAGTTEALPLEMSDPVNAPPTEAEAAVAATTENVVVPETPTTTG